MHITHITNKHLVANLDPYKTPWEKQNCVIIIWPFTMPVSLSIKTQG